MAAITWTGAAGDGNFNNPANWSPAQVPGATDTVTISPKAATLINIGTADAVQALKTSTTVTLAVGDNASLTVGNAATKNAALTNAGTITLNAYNYGSGLIIGGPEVTLSGGGTILMGTGGGNYITGAAAGDVLNNTGNLIEGAGQLGNGSLTYINGAGATVDAIDGNTLVLNTGANVITNAGLLEATAGGGLVIQSSVSNGTGGHISAIGANVYLQSGADVSGGTLTSAGGFAVADSNTATLDGSTTALTNLGLVAVQDNTALTLLGSVANSGTIALSAYNYLSDLVIGPGGKNPGTVTLSGKGTIALGNSTGNRIYGAIAGDTLVNMGNTIVGAGQLGVGTLTLINDGTIDANTGNALYLNTGAATTINNALMEATGGASLVIQSRVDSSGGGTILAANSTVQLNGGTLAGGLVSTTGTAGALTVNGSGALDGSAQTVTIKGVVDVNDNATLSLAGTITNAGTIAVNAYNYTTYLEVAAASVSLTGGGTIVLSNSGLNDITASAAGEALVNVNNLIEGAGQFGAGTLTFTNGAAGIVDATLSNQLVLNTGTVATVNMGLLEASAGSSGLVIQTNVNNGTTGAISAAGGNVFLASGADIVGGTLSSSGTGSILDSNTATLGAIGGTITNIGTVALQDGTTLTLLGTILNQDVLAVDAYNYSTDLVIGSATTVGTTTLSGGGTVSLAGNGNNRLYAAAPGDTLVNLNNTIIGDGQFGIGSDGLLLVNDAIIEAAGGVLTINTGAVVTNNALMEATGGSALYIDGTINSSGGGTILAASGNVVLNGGTLAGGIANSAAGFAVVDLNQGTLDGRKQTVTNKGSISLNDGSTLTLLGTITNQGTIALNAYNYHTDLIVGTPTVTLTGSGTILLGNSTSNRIYGTSGVDKLVNVNNTIEGAGQIGTGQMILVNQAHGVIDANQAAGLYLTSAAGGTITNAGLIESTASGGLVVQTAVNSSTGGTILANGGNVYLSTGSLAGGVLASGSNGGMFIDNGGGFALDGSAQTLTNNTDVSLVDGATLTLLGTITNHGTIALNAYNYLTDLIAGGPTVTLTGSGTILLGNNSGNNRLYGATPSDTLVNVNNLIEGGGQIGAGQLTLVNQAAGIIDANSGAALYLNASGTITNAGLIESTGGGGLLVQTTIDSSSGGTILAAGGNVYLNGGTLAGGLLKSSGGGAFLANGVETLDGSAHTLTSDALVSISDGATMTLLGNIANNGTILFNAYNYNTDLIIGSPTVTLTGTGTVQLGAGGARIYGATAANVLDNVSNLIDGYGQLGAGQLTLVNGGVINANSNGTLYVNLGSTGLNTATGTMVATSASGMVFQNGTYTNLGLYEATDGSVLTFQSGATLTNDSAGGTLTGGTYEAFATSQNAIVSITGAAVTTLAANIVLSGVNSTVAFGGTAIDASLSTIGTAGMLSILNGRNYTVGANGGTLTDNGTITLGGGTFSDTQLVIGSKGDFSGFGTLAGPVSNSGTIDAIGGKLVLSGAVSGGGTITTGAGGIIDLTGGGTITQPISGSGTLELGGGTFTIADSKITIANLAVDANTSLIGTGTVTSQVVDTGTITANGGTLSLTGPVSGTGTLAANAKSVLIVGGGSMFGGTIAGPGTVDLVGPTTLLAGIKLSAAAIMQSSTVTLASGVSVTNLAGNTYTLTSNAPGQFTPHRAEIQIRGGGGNMFTNAGSLVADATALIAVAFDNTGSLADSRGTLTVSGALTGTGAISIGRPAALSLTGGATYAGAFTGVGTLSLASAVTLNAGASLGVSHVIDTNVLTLGSGENIKIGGGNIFALADAGGNDPHRAEVAVQGGSGNTFTNAGTVTASALADSFNLKFVNSGLAEATAGTLSFLGAVTNTGTFDATGGATISLAKIVTGTGAAQIDTASTLTLLGGSGAGQTVGFLAASGALDLGHPLSFAGTIDGFGGSDVIDLLKTASTSETFAAGVLTVQDNGATVASLHFAGSYSTADFLLSSDNNGGTNITFV